MMGSIKCHLSESVESSRYT